MRPVALITNTLVSIAAIILFLLLFELFLNIFPGLSFYYGYPTGLFQNAEAPLDFELVPNFHGRMKSGEYNVAVSINSRGIRDYLHTDETRAGKRRILALGDSFTFGNGVEISNSYPSIVEELLGIEIVKAGVPGYGQDNELAYYVFKGFEYTPDSVMIFYSLTDNDNNNDVNDRKVTNGVLIQKKSYESMPAWKQNIYSRLYQIKTLRLAKRAMSGLVASFDKNLAIQSNEKLLFSPEQTKESIEWNETARLFKKFRKAIPEHVKLIIAYVPVKQQVYPEASKEYFGEGTDIDKPNTVLKEIAEEINAEYIDVTTKLREAGKENKDLYFKHDGHFTIEGNRKYAQEIASKLREILQ